jgi:hypothetical protein
MNLTTEQKNQWINNPNINPLTGRKIKETGRIYRQIEIVCNILSESRIQCKKWMKIPYGEASFHYELPQYIKCMYCDRNSKAMLHIIHADNDEIGDYYCYLCEKDCRLGYFCYKCHNKEEC